MIELQAKRETQSLDLIIDAERITLGRSSETAGNHIRIDDGLVSRDQLTISIQDDRVAIENTGELVTFDNGMVLKRGQHVELFLPTTMTMGHTTVTLASLSDEPTIVFNTVINWVNKIKADDQQASADLWEKYYRRLIAFARKKIGSLPKRTSDEEDVVVDAFDSFFRGLKAGRFIDLNDHTDLWRVLAMLTARKISKEIGYQLALKRGAGQIRGESVFISATGETGGGIQELSRETMASPDMLLEIQENIGQMLNPLSKEQQNICMLKLEGFTNAEIAERLDVNERTVERRLKAIRSNWQSLLTEGSDE